MSLATRLAFVRLALVIWTFFLNQSWFEEGLQAIADERARLKGLSDDEISKELDRWKRR